MDHALLPGLVPCTLLRRAVMCRAVLCRAVLWCHRSVMDDVSDRTVAWLAVQKARDAASGAHGGEHDDPNCSSAPVGATGNGTAAADGTAAAGAAPAAAVIPSCLHDQWRFQTLAPIERCMAAGNGSDVDVFGVGREAERLADQPYGYEPLPPGPPAGAAAGPGEGGVSESGSCASFVDPGLKGATFPSHAAANSEVAAAARAKKHADKAARQRQREEKRAKREGGGGGGGGRGGDKGGKEGGRE